LMSKASFAASVGAPLVTPAAEEQPASGRSQRPRVAQSSRLVAPRALSVQGARSVRARRPSNCEGLARERVLDPRTCLTTFCHKATPFHADFFFLSLMSFLGTLRQILRSIFAAPRRRFSAPPSRCDVLCKRPRAHRAMLFWALIACTSLLPPHHSSSYGSRKACRVLGVTRSNPPSVIAVLRESGPDPPSAAAAQRGSTSQPPNPRKRPPPAAAAQRGSTSQPPNPRKRPPPAAAAQRGSTSQPSPRKLNGLLGNLTSAPALLALHRQHGASFDHVNMATCWSRLGRVRSGERRWLRAEEGVHLIALREQTRDRVRTFGARSLANTAHALAKLALRGEEWTDLWEEFERAVLARRGDFNPQQLANTAWAFATAVHAAPALFDAIAEESSKQVGKFKAQDMANTAWAFATAGHTASALFDAIAAESAGRVREFKPQELANTAWAFATAGQAAPALFDAIAAEAVGRVREFKPQELANTAWAFATAGHAAPALFDAIAAEAVRRVREFNSHALANTAWAFATAGHAAPALFEAAAEEAIGKMREFKPLPLANTAWAFATAGRAAPALFEAIAEQSAGQVHEFKPQELANTAWAFATAGHAAPQKILEAITEDSSSRIGDSPA